MSIEFNNNKYSSSWYGHLLPSGHKRGLGDEEMELAHEANTLYCVKTREMVQLYYEDKSLNEPVVEIDVDDLESLDEWR